MLKFFLVYCSIVHLSDGLTITLSCCPILLPEMNQYFLETRISISIRRRGMFCSRLTGAWNQFVATQYSVVCYYGIM